MADQYDVVVIGAGPGGYVAAIRAAQLGLKVACVEKKWLGGVCLNIGCIPSKALLKNAEYIHTIKKRGKELGFSYDNLTVDYGVAFKRSRTTSGRLVKGIGFLFRKYGVEHIEGYGTLVDANTIKVDGENGEQTLSAKNIIVATGARPRELPGLEFDGEKVISYIEAIQMDTLPKSVVVVGSGAIGVEFSYIWSNYDVKVTMVEIADRMLPREEPEISAVMQKAYKKLGVDFKAKTTVTNVDKSAADGVKVTLSDGSEIEADFVMVAAAFAPNVENVGLEAVGVQLSDRGMVAVDSQMRTNVPNIYAIGDCTGGGGKMLAHVASAMGHVAAEVIAGHETVELDYRMIPGATYAIPQVASFGYTEAAAIEAGYDINIGTFPFSANGRALGMGEKDGFVKIISDKKYGEILGAHMVGPDVAELLPELTLAQQMEMTAEEIARNIHAHPTLSEVVMEAAHNVEGQSVHN